MGLFSTTTKQKQQQWLDIAPWMQGMPQDIANEVMNQMRAGGDPREQVAGFTPYEEAGIAGMAGYGQPGGRGFDISEQVYGGAGDMLGMGQQGYQAFLGAGPSANMGVDIGQVGQYINNDVLQAQIDAATRDIGRGLHEQALPQARLAQAASGGTGGTRGAIGEAILTRGAEDRAADVAGQMRGQAYQQALGIGAQQAAQNAQLRQQYVGQLGQMGLAGFGQGLQGMQQAYGLGMGGFEGQLAAGGMQRELEQAMLDRERLDPYERLGFTSGIINPMAQQYGTQQMRGKGKTSGGMGAALTQAAGALGAAWIMASDPRVKKHVTYKGRLGPHNLYEYEYLDGTKSMGVMADEVAEVNPGAVLDAGGIMAVDYSKL